MNAGTTSNVLNKKIITESFSGILNSLSEKERTVINRRIGMQSGIKETLQNIGNSFKPQITRERVRQIEEAGIKKIGRIIKATDLITIQEKAKELIALHGGILTKEKIINGIIKELSLEKDINVAILEVVVQSDEEMIKSKPRLGTRTYFYFATVSRKLIDSVHKESLKVLKKKKDVMERETLYALVKENISESFKNVSSVLIDSIIDIFEEFIKWEETLVGLTKWKILNPKTLKDKAIYVMKKEKIPMHFVDISNKITEYLWDAVKISTIHNELIRNTEFVLVGRGIYALKEWGFKPGTVLDTIVDIMKKAWEPMNTEDITNKVLKVRNVKKTTIYMNLQNKKVIERVGRNFYQIKDQ